MTNGDSLLWVMSHSLKAGFYLHTTCFESTGPVGRCRRRWRRAGGVPDYDPHGGLGGLRLGSELRTGHMFTLVEIEADSVL